MILLIAKACLCVVGLFLVGMTTFVTETEEGQLANRLQRLWVDAERNREGALGLQAALLREVAALVSRFLDRWLGRDVISLRAGWISACLTVGLACHLTAGASNPTGERIDPAYVEPVAFVLLIVAFSFAKSERVGWIATAIFWGAVFTLILAAGGGVGTMWYRTTLLVGVASWTTAVGFFQSAILHLFRLSLRRAAQERGFWTIVRALVGQAVVPVLFVVGPEAVFLAGLLHAGVEHQREEDLLHANIPVVLKGVPFFLIAQVIALVSLIFVLPSLLFAVVYALAFLHVLGWEAIRRPLIALNRHFDLVKHRNLYRGIGMLMIGIAVSEKGIRSMLGALIAAARAG